MSNERWIAGAAAALLLGVSVLAVARHGAQAPEVVLDYSVDGPGLNVDDACFWVDPSDPAESLLFVTVKDSVFVEVYKAATGAFVTTIPGFGRPNNCAVDGDLLLTTDRDAPDVKVHHLPDLALVRTFGADTLQPHGIDVLHTTDGQSHVYVTDSGDSSVHIYDLPTGALVSAFTTPGWGLGIEPVVADDRYQRVFLSREEGNNAHGIGLFTPEGTLVKEFGANLFSKDTEGLAIYKCGDEGYLIASDQRTDKNQFEVFDRVTLAHLGTFTMHNGSGEYTNSTDGIDILQTPLPGFPNGMFAACDGCGSTLPDELDVVSWDKIASALDLDLCPNGVAPDCVTTPCHERIAAIADAMVTDEAPTTNFGAAEELQIDGAPVDQTLLRFDVPDLTGFDVLDATVRLTVSTANGAGSAAGGSLYESSGAWTESTVTYDTRPIPVGAPIDANGVVGPGETVDFDVQTALEEGAVNDFLLLSASGDQAVYRSREALNSPPALLLTLHASSTPDLTITGPADGAVLPQGTPVELTATAIDAEDGDISARVAWQSDRDGTLGTGGTLTTALSPGAHVIAANVTDHAGLGDSASIQVSINSGAEVTITAPDAGTSVAGGTPLSFTGSAIDPTDGDLSASIVWTSSRDGVLGTGAAIQVTLSEGAHVITASATDPGGATGTATRAVTVTPAPPTLVIDAPLAGAAIVNTEPMVLSATATDFADGNLGAKVKWSSNLQGVLGTGAKVTALGLKLGTHVITAQVTDTSGLSVQAQAELRVAAPTMSLTAVADAYVSNKTPANNFGTASTLQADASPAVQTFLRFAVTGLAGLRVDRAVLQLTVSTASGSDSVAGGKVYALTDNGWGETTVTYATRPPIDGPELGTVGAVAKSQLVEIDVTPAVTQDGSLTLALVTTSNDDVKYKSRDTSSGRPKLILSLRSAVVTNAPPMVTITAPAEGTTLASGTPLVLSASANDFEDGDISSAVSWTSDIVGALGGGSPLAVPSLPVGTHTITASVLDADGQPGTAVIHVIVTPAGAFAFTPVADSYVGSDAPTKNYGTVKTMAADASPIRQMFLRFDVTGLAGRQVDTATLRLTTDSASSAASAKGGAVRAIADTGWTETDLTYNTRPPIAGTALATAGAVGAAQQVDFVVTPAVTGDGAIVFALNTTSSDGVTYMSREGGAGAPQLLITSSLIAPPQPTATPLVVVTATPLATITQTPVPTVTTTPVPTVTATLNPTITATTTPLPTATATAVPSATHTATAVPTATVTATTLPTATVTAVPTATVTALPTATATPPTDATRNGPRTTTTATVTALPTATVTATPVATVTAAETPLPTATQTAIPTVTATDTPLPSATATPVPTTTATQTAVPTVTATVTPLPSATATPVPTTTATQTAVPTATVTAVPTSTVTETPPPAATATLTALPTPTTTPTAVAVALTQLGTAVARVTAPLGAGSKTLATIRDGDKPAAGSGAQALRQYDTYDGSNTATDDWIGYVYDEPHTFERVVFQEGIHFWDGGWFDTFTVQVRQGGVWKDVVGITCAPAYPASDNGIWFETYTLRFAPMTGDGIRLDGRPGGSSDFISVAELEVYGDAALAP